MPDTTPGWYPDPNNHSIIRYHDGRQWTDQTEQVPMPPPKKRGYGWLIAGGVVLAIIVVIGAAALAASTSKSSSSSPATTPTPTAVESFQARQQADASESRAAQASQARQTRLADRTNYMTVSSREWQIIAKNPDSHVGELYVVYGRVVQADSGTGQSTIRINTNGEQVEQYDYDINTVVTEGDPGRFNEIVEDDLVQMWVEVDGSTTYDTTMGGSITAPSVTAHMIERYGTGD
ncbi:DUF2510 domain-containing protein [Gordonia sp. L191]|uniref:DUF2510 domain-containing protein n=1 Tax=Gordonia sp. L191 TaxID=2982699 RepID=UPI0024C094BB|nr:DUF2510 domain-containing protein [Gordonia sp. L191]WHU45088.1 DUF2510 domain-containing protein [Gordonia sp. L191]